MSTQVDSPLPPEASSRFAYDFLAYPPSPRTRRVEPQPPTPTVRATVRSISRRRSSSISATSWSTPPAPSRRPSQFRSPRSARRHSATFLSYLPTPTHTHTHASDLHTPSDVVPLPPSFFPSNKDNDYPFDMRFTLAAPRQNEGTIPVHASPTPAKQKGFIRFLRPGLRPRSTMKAPSQRHVQQQPAPPLSPTTAAFRIAHQKRVYYTRNGALPLPLEAEVELMQFADGGSRADAIARLGTAYTDAAGVVYADETEATECFPLLLAPEDCADDNTTTHHSVMPPHYPAPAPPAFAQSFVIAGSADAAAYVHLATSVPPARGKARRRMPGPLLVQTGLRPAVIGFDDSFMPSCGGSEASAMRNAKKEFRGLRDMRRV